MRNDDEILHKKWLDIRQSCNNPNNNNFYYYGGKGIIICEEWDCYENFKNWSINNGYKNNLVLSRKNTNDDYCPENCEWIADSEHRTKRRKIIEFNGEKITLVKLSEITGISKTTLNSRLLQGCTGTDLIRKPNHGLKMAI